MARPDPRSRSLSGETTLIISVLALTTFVMLLNETALSVALPSIMTEFDVTSAVAQWLLTGVLLTMAIMMPMTGWILDRFTTRSVYFFAVGAFLIGSVVAAFSPTFVILLGGRVLQAVGTAILLPLQMTVVMTVVPPKVRGTVMGVIAIVMAVGPALGPTFAGAVMSVSTWHTTFWIMAALVAVAAAFAAWKLRNVSELKRAPLDVVSVVLSAIAFGGLVYGLSSVGVLIDGGDGAGVVIGVSIAGVIGLALFIWRQLALAPSGRALLDLTPLTVKNFVVAIIVIVLFQAAMLGMANTLPLYLQGALLTTALVAGLASLPGGLVETVLSPIAGAFYDRVGPRPLVVPGTLIGAAALLWMGTVSEESPVWLLVVQYTIFGVAMALSLTPLITTALSSLPSEIYSHGSAILNTLLQLAGAAGIAVMIAIIGHVAGAGGGTRAAQGDGAATAFMVCGGLLVVAVIAALFLRKPEDHGEVKTVDSAEPA
ncbi:MULTISPECIES: DHA2 family efflux MFS transporter permease subunit [unclassified Corynebacterium]|uniref:DHA2 family efflux MFS transporter permease subunit n=1 Tax=unclassified Corynebacterium TaxID=2624378 RepID=UPI0034CE4ED7